MNELTEGIGVLGQLRKYQQEIKELVKLSVQKEMSEIEQILGKALGYPWYKDDPKNFPNATEADGVCVGDHTAWSLAMEAADLIAKLKKRHPTTEEALAQYHWLKENSKRNK